MQLSCGPNRTFYVLGDFSKSHAGSKTSIHLFSITAPPAGTQGGWGLGKLSSGRVPGQVCSSSQGWRVETKPAFTLRDNLESPNLRTCMSLDCGRRSESTKSRKTWVRIEPKTSLLQVDSHCAAVLPDSEKWQIKKQRQRWESI